MQPVTPSLAYAASASLRGAVPSSLCHARPVDTAPQMRHRGLRFPRLTERAVAPCRRAESSKQASSGSDAVCWRDDTGFHILTLSQALAGRQGRVCSLPSMFLLQLHQHLWLPHGPRSPGSTYPQVGAGVAQGGQDHCSLT